MSITFDPTFRAFVDALSMLLNSLYDAVTTLPRAEVNLELISPDPHSPELLRVSMLYVILHSIKNLFHDIIRKSTL